MTTLDNLTDIKFTPTDIKTAQAVIYKVIKNFYHHQLGTELNTLNTDMIEKAIYQVASDKKKQNKYRNFKTCQNTLKNALNLAIINANINLYSKNLADKILKTNPNVQIEPLTIPFINPNFSAYDKTANSEKSLYCFNDQNQLSVLFSKERLNQIADELTNLPQID